MCPKLIELLSWNGPTAHICYFMLARASTKTFVRRIHILQPNPYSLAESKKQRKIFASRIIRQQGHSLAEVSLYSKHETVTENKFQYKNKQRKSFKIKEFERTFISSRNCQTAIQLPVKLTIIAPHTCFVFTVSFIRSTDVSQYSFQHHTTVLRVMSSPGVSLISHTEHANHFSSYDRLIPRPKIS